MAKPTSPASGSPIKAVLFDIGGVVVLSPMLAIASYERTHGLPAGYINHAIVRSTLHGGAWGHLERGQIPLDAHFFARFTADLSHPSVWAEYCARTGHDRGEVKVPAIDGGVLFRDMMRMTREFDPYVAPAIRRLRGFTDEKGRRRYVVGACTNDYMPPTDGEDARNDDDDGRLKELRALFDVWVSSSGVGMRKPERRMYEFAMAKLSEAREWLLGSGSGAHEKDLRPAEVLFLDDIGMNLKGAGKVGLRGIKVPLKETWRAVQELESTLGLPKGALFENGVVERLKREGKWESKVQSKL